ncbi:tyrosine-type recombinase/integrase [Rhodococcus ruber]|uniref:tyrosine-type recombinase/integrase n=1 Tax=Rhodococcus ruber TaxID=1830 RepID=UPI001F3305DA|nr:site-specific integrase [Rhodococcus ruber]MCF8783390.1 site-specific integrase [Rhodococcus ruber]
MPRHPLPPGSHGAISCTPIHRRRIERANGRIGYRDVALVRYEGAFYALDDTDHTTPLEVAGYRAKCRVRDHDGRTRQSEAWGPSKAAATRALEKSLTQRHAPTGGATTPDTRVSALWATYRAQLVDDGKAARTIDSYDRAAAFIERDLGGLRIREVTTQRLEVFLRDVEERHGPSTAKLCRSVLSGAFGMAVRYGATDRNPVREVRPTKSTRKAAHALTADDVHVILHALRTSADPMPPARGAKRQTSRLTVAEYAREADVVDVVTFLAGTGVRIGEALALRWQDVDLDAETVSIEGHVVSVRGQGLVRIDGAKSATGVRTLPLPSPVMDMLRTRKAAPMAEVSAWVFPSQTGRLRDADTFRKSWRRLSAAIGYPGTGTHAFRRALATQLDADGQSARVTADVLGHAKVSMTQDVYLGRGRLHDVVAGVIEAAFWGGVESEDSEQSGGKAVGSAPDNRSEGDGKALSPA